MTTDQQSGMEATTATDAIEFRVWRPGMPVRRLRLSGARYTLGSSSGCSIRLDDPSLRPMHAVILRDPQRTLLRAYTVPVEVNGRRTTEAILQPGDLFALGQYQFQFVDPNDPQTAGDSQRAAASPAASAASTAAPTPAAPRPAAPSAAGAAGGTLQSPRRVAFAGGMRLSADVAQPPVKPVVDPAARLREQHYQAQLADVLSRLQQTQQRADQANLSIDAMRQQIDQLAQQLAGAAETAQRYHDQQQELQQANQQAHDGRLAAERQRDQAIHEQATASQQRDQAQQAAEATQLQAQQARQQCQQLTRQRDAAIEQLEQLTQQRDEAIEQVEQLTGRCQAIGEQLEQASENCRRLIQQRDSFAEQRDRAAQERDALAQQCESLVEQRDSLAEQCDSLAEQRDRIVEERNGLVDERDSLAEQRDAMAADRGRLTADRDRIADLLSDMQQQRDQVAATVQQQREQLADQQAESERLEQQIAQLQQYADAARQEADDLADQCRDAQRTVARLEKQIQDADRARQQDRLSWEAEAAELRDAVQDVTRELTTTAAQLAHSREAADALTVQLTEARDALATAQAQPQNDQAAEAELAAIRRRLEDTEEQLERLRREYDGRDVAPAPHPASQGSAWPSLAAANAAEAASAVANPAANLAAAAATPLVPDTVDDDEDVDGGGWPMYAAAAPTEPQVESQVEPQTDAHADSIGEPAASAHTAWMARSPWGLPAAAADHDAANDDAAYDDEPTSHTWSRQDGDAVAAADGPAAVAGDTDAASRLDDQDPASGDSGRWQAPQALQSEGQLARQLLDQLGAQQTADADEPSQSWDQTYVMPADGAGPLATADARDDQADDLLSLRPMALADDAAGEPHDPYHRPAWAIEPEPQELLPADDQLVTSDDIAAAVGYDDQIALGAGDDLTATVDDNDAATASGVAGAEEDDSIEAYMNRLLQRVQGRSGGGGTGETSTRWTPPASTTDSTTTSSPATTSLRASMKLVPESPSSTTAGAATGTADTADASAATPGGGVAEPFVPRSTAPERGSNLAAMRELANSSARTAIQRSVRQRAQATVIARFAQAGASVSVGTALWISSQLQFGWRLLAAICLTFLAAYWVYEAFQLYASLRRSAAAEACEAAAAAAAEPADEPADDDAAPLA